MFRPEGPLRIASCMAQNADAMCRELTGYLARVLDVPAVFVEDIPWQKRERLLDEGAIDLCWICGLPYAQKADRKAEIELCVAPVMQAQRYAGMPLYYSDVVVRAASAYREFADLRGASWAYNEPRSHSGFNLVRYHLAREGYSLGFFGPLTEAGSHQAALRLILKGEVAGAAIDSTVLDVELALNPELESQIRCIAVLGPSPAPPWVMSTRMPACLRGRIRRCLISMSSEAAGRRVLESWRIAELRAVQDADYDSIRAMARTADAAVLEDTRTSVHTIDMRNG